MKHLSTLPLLLAHCHIDAFIANYGVTRATRPAILSSHRCSDAWRPKRRRRNTTILQLSEQAHEAVTALREFHNGHWQGLARSFAVTPDVAAGIVQRQSSAPYAVHVQWSDNELQERIEFASAPPSTRQLSLSKSNLDVDVVDGTYSLDQSLPDLPAALLGTSKLAQFAVEHCIAVNDNMRARCWALYGPDQTLLRVVVGEETRLDGDSPSSGSGDSSTTTLSANDIIEMQSDVDRLVDRIAGSIDAGRNKDQQPPPAAARRMDRLDELQSAMSAGGRLSAKDGEASLQRHPATLLELSAGVWLGDTIIRDMPMLSVSPLERGRGGGFGSSSSSSTHSDRQRAGIKMPSSPSWGSWTLGVQKTAWRWMWNFGDEIRQTHDVGKAMGAESSPALAQSLAGTVCVNEGLSRRIPKQDRMVYIDWSSDNIGFLLGSYAIQLPRYLTFDAARSNRPFYTLFGVFQSSATSANGVVEDQPALKDVVCSQSFRVYNFEGKLKQGCTAFFALKRFGSDESDV